MNAEECRELRSRSENYLRQERVAAKIRRFLAWSEPYPGALQDEPKTCPVCGSSDVVDDECQACAEIAREEDAAEAPSDEP